MQQKVTFFISSSTRIMRFHFDSCGHYKRILKDLMIYYDIIERKIGNSLFIENPGGTKWLMAVSLSGLSKAIEDILRYYECSFKFLPCSKCRSYNLDKRYGEIFLHYWHIKN